MTMTNMTITDVDFTFYLNSCKEIDFHKEIIVSVKKTREYPKHISLFDFPIVYKKNNAISILLQIFKKEIKHKDSKLYYQTIGSFVETHKKHINYGNDFSDVIREYYNTDIYNIPDNSFTISQNYINYNSYFVFYIYRFTYYNVHNEPIQIDINEYYYFI